MDLNIMTDASILLVDRPTQSTPHETRPFWLSGIQNSCGTTSAVLLACSVDMSTPLPTPSRSVSFKIPMNPVALGGRRLLHPEHDQEGFH